MKKFLSIVLTIAMIASFAVTTFAYNGLVVTGGTSGTDYEIAGDDKTLNVIKDFTCEKITCGYNPLTINLNGNTLTVNNSTGNGILGDSNIIINGSGTLNVVASGSGIVASKYMSVITINKNSYVTINAPVAISVGDPGGSIKIDDNGATTTINEGNVATYFNGTNVSYSAGDSKHLISATGIITFGTPSTSSEIAEEDNSDPEVELDLGNGPVTVKTSNNSVVFNDTKVFETNIGDGDIFVPIDLSSAPKKIDGLFFNNEVYKYIDDSGKDIELINRFAKAEVYTNKEVGNNPLSLHLSDVSEIPGTCATYLQKKAMNTNKVYAQVNYSFVSNGKPTENDAKIYVPVSGPAKVFYLFNENKIGTVPCEVKDGYCVFDRYFDGTYVVCATK